MPTVRDLLLLMTGTALVLTLAGGLALRYTLRRARRTLAARLRRRLPLLAARATADSAPAPGLHAVRVLAQSRAAAAVEMRVWAPAPGRDVAVVRRDLRREVTGATRAVTAGRQAGRPVEGLGSVVRRLTEQAGALDVDLRVIAAEPRRAVRRRLLADQADRVDLLRRACEQVRRAVLLAGSSTTLPLLSAMMDDLHDEVIALALRARAYQELAGLS